MLIDAMCSANPFTVVARISPHIVSFALISSGSYFFSHVAFISSRNPQKCELNASTSSGSLAEKISGKKSGMGRPGMRFVSVTAGAFPRCRASCVSRVDGVEEGAPVACRAKLGAGAVRTCGEEADAEWSGKTRFPGRQC